jgi:hypothetical protein
MLASYPLRWKERLLTRDSPQPPATNLYASLGTMIQGGLLGYARRVRWLWRKACVAMPAVALMTVGVNASAGFAARKSSIPQPFAANAVNSPAAGKKSSPRQHALA